MMTTTDKIIDTLQEAANAVRTLADGQLVLKEMIVEHARQADNLIGELRDELHTLASRLDAHLARHDAHDALVSEELNALDPAVLKAIAPEHPANRG